jgi:hypothetical protein
MTARQAEGEPAVSVVESGTDDGGLSRLRSTASAVFDGKGERLRPDRSHMGERIWSVGDRPSDGDHRPGVEHTIGNEADDTALLVHRKSDSVSLPAWRQWDAAA